MKINSSLIALASLFFLISFSSALDCAIIDGQKIPNEVGSVVGNQNINLFLDNAFTCSIFVKNGNINSSSVSFEKPSLEIYVMSSTVDKIELAEDKTDAALTAYKSGEIKIVKKTLMNKIKFFFAKFFI